MYYVYDCNEEQMYTATRAELYRFVKKNLTAIGNFPEQKKIFLRPYYVWGI